MSGALMPAEFADLVDMVTQLALLVARMAPNPGAVAGKLDDPPAPGDSSDRHLWLVE